MNYRKYSRISFPVIVLFLFLHFTTNPSHAFICSIFSQESSNQRLTIDVEHTNITILGAGTFGTAVGNALAYAGFHVRIWTKHSTHILEEINTDHTSEKLLDRVGKKIPLSNNLKGVLDLREAVQVADIIFFAVTSKGAAKTAEELSHVMHTGTPSPIIVSLDKGFGYLINDEKEKHPLRMLDIIAHYLPSPYSNKNLVYASGPMLAQEIALEKETFLVVASRNIANARKVQTVMNTAFGAEMTKDVAGTQVCAATKNPLAIMYGILEAAAEKNVLSIGKNTIAAYFTYALEEMQFLAKTISPRMYKRTVAGLAGAADFHVTTEGGRNVKFGKGTAKDYFDQNVLEEKLRVFQKRIQEIETSRKSEDTIEGIAATRSIYILSKQMGISLPIIETLYRILYEGARLEDELPRLVQLLPKAYPKTTPKGPLKDRIFIWGRNTYDLFFNGD